MKSTKKHTTKIMNGEVQIEAHYYEVPMEILNSVISNLIDLNVGNEPMVMVKEDLCLRNVRYL